MEKEKVASWNPSVSMGVFYVFGFLAFLINNALNITPEWLNFLAMIFTAFALYSVGIFMATIFGGSPEENKQRLASNLRLGAWFIGLLVALLIAITQLPIILDVILFVLGFFGLQIAAKKSIRL